MIQGKASKQAAILVWFEIWEPTSERARPTSEARRVFAWMRRLLVGWTVEVQYLTSQDFLLQGIGATQETEKQFLASDFKMKT